MSETELDQEIDKIVTPNRVSDSEFSPPRLQYPANASLLDFYKTFRALINVHNPDIVVAPAYPPELFPGDKQETDEVFKDTITYLVKTRVPGTIGGPDKGPMGSVRQLKPRIIEYRSPNAGDPLSSAKIAGMWFDNWIQFDCFSSTYEGSEELIDWLETVLITYERIFNEIGIDQCFFVERATDQDAQFGNYLHIKSLIYYVRTQKLIVRSLYNIQEVAVKVKKVITDNTVITEEDMEDI